MRRGLVLLALALASAAAVPAAVTAAPRPARNDHPLLTPDPQAVRAAKERPAGAGLVASPFSVFGAQPSGRAWAVSGLNKPGIGAGDNSAFNEGTPPDPTGAVGPSHYVEIVNSKVAIYDKTSLSLVAGTHSPQDLEAFVGSPGHSVFDPQIQWDPQASRWLYVADDCTIEANGSSCITRSRLAYGFSKTSDPTGAWCNYFINSSNPSTGTLFDDYPKLGHNNSHIIIGTNVFDSALLPPKDFVGSRVWTVAKTLNALPGDSCPSAPTPHFYSGAPSSSSPGATYAADSATFATGASKLRTLDGDVVVTPVPANTFESLVNGYVVAADYPSPNPARQVMVWHVDSSGALIADSNVDVTAYDFPFNAPQPGSSSTIDTSDTRLTQAVVRTDPDVGAPAIWTQHTVNGSGGRSVVRWYELMPTQTTKKRQEGTIADSSSFVFSGAISPSRVGNDAVVEYSASGTAQLPQIRAQSRVSSTTLGAMVGEVTLGTSTNADADGSCTPGPCRWGDYSAATPDPSADHVLWGTNELIGPSRGTFVSGNRKSHWTTRNFALVTTGGPTAALSIAPNPAFNGKLVQFDASASNDSSDGGTLTYDIDFGDGSPHASTATATHVYNQPRTYSARATVTDSDQNAIDTRTVAVVVGSNAPTASFTVAPGTVTRPGPVTFNGSASHDAEAPGGIATYGWDFDGNGTIDQTTTTPTVTHVYTSIGTFSPKLVVTDADDGASSAPASATVTVQNASPVARLSFAPNGPIAGDTVTIYAGDSTDPDGTIVRYEWDLDGNGTFETDGASNPTVKRLVTAAGSFPVAVRITDNDGATSIATGRITVAPFAPLRLTLTAAKKAKVSRVIAKGVSVSARCNRPCNVGLIARIPTKIARALRVNPIVGGARANLGTSSTTVFIELSKQARRALRGLRSVVMKVEGSANEGGKTAPRRTLSVKLGR